MFFRCVVSSEVRNTELLRRRQHRLHVRTDDCRHVRCTDLHVRWSTGQLHVLVQQRSYCFKVFFQTCPTNVHWYDLLPKSGVTRYWRGISWRRHCLIFRWLDLKKKFYGVENKINNRFNACMRVPNSVFLALWLHLCLQIFKRLVKGKLTLCSGKICYCSSISVFVPSMSEFMVISSRYSVVWNCMSTSTNDRDWRSLFQTPATYRLRLAGWSRTSLNSSVADDMFGSSAITPLQHVPSAVRIRFPVSLAGVPLNYTTCFRSVHYTLIHDIKYKSASYTEKNIIMHEHSKTMATY